MQITPKKKFKTITVKDSIGRNFTIEELHGAKKFQIVKIAGTDALNASYLSLCGVLASIIAIDGQQIPFPQSIEDLHNLFDEIGEAGLEAATNGFLELTKNELH